MITNIEHGPCDYNGGPGSDQCPHGVYMTDPQTPATEAGRLAEMRRFHNGRHQATDFCDACAIVAMLPAIEAQAGVAWKLADYEEGEAFGYERGRADALREAAERVRALRNDKLNTWWHEDTAWFHEEAVLALLAEQKP